MDQVYQIWFDGSCSGEQASVHVATHTLHYGPGAFEGIRCYKLHDGRSAILRLDEHVRRLFDSAHIRMLPMPYSQEQIVEACLETVPKRPDDYSYGRSPSWARGRYCSERVATRRMWQWSRGAWGLTLVKRC